jgi:hypothetical protein
MFVPASNGYQDTGQIAVRLDPVEFTGLDQFSFAPCIYECVGGANFEIQQ